MIYCVVPRPLEDELFDRLTNYYKDEPNVEVIVDRRAQGGLPGERGERFEHRHEPDVTGRRGQRLVRVGDGVVAVEHGEERGDADADLRHPRQLRHRHGARARDAVVVGPVDGDACDASSGEIVGELLRPRR